MSRILFVVTRPLEINTSASIRNKAMIEGFIENGNAVDILSSEPDKNHNAYDESLSVANAGHFVVPLGQTQKMASLCNKYKFLKRFKSFIYKAIYGREVYDYLKTVTNRTDVVNLKENKYDYIISSSDPKSSHLFVIKLLEKQGEFFNGKWIQIWGDPFLADVTRNKGNNKKIKQEEHRLLEASDFVFYVSKLTLEKQKSLYPDCADKMLYTPIPYMEKREYPVRNLRNAGIVELAYCGDYLSNVRDILPLYDCVNTIDNVHLTICGMSNLRLESTEKVSVYPRLNRSKLEEIESKADILVHLSNLKGSQIPGKIYQYSGTNKPILFILDGEKENIRSQFEAYNRYYFSNNSVVEIDACIKSIIDDENPLIESSALKFFSPDYLSNQILEKVREGV